MICRKCHDWLEQLSNVERESVNDELREYKRKIDYGIAVAQITTKGIAQAQVIEFEEPEEVIEVPVYETTPEEQQMLIERRKKQYAKFNKVYEPPRKKAVIDREWQKEILEDNLMELRY